MAARNDLEKWTNALLDTGKRNNLISFKNPKSLSAEIVFPEAGSVFGGCTEGREFTVFDPKIHEEDPDEEETGDARTHMTVKFGRDEFIKAYRPKVERDPSKLLAYAQTDNPITAVRNIAKKAREIQEETGIDPAYLVFDFVFWREKETSEQFYRAPLLLVKVSVETKTVLDPVKIRIEDDDVFVNPAFRQLLWTERGIDLPEYEDGDTLSEYAEKAKAVIDRLKLGWSIEKTCKLSIFSFMKVNMYEDLKNHPEKILANENVRAILREEDGSHSGGLSGLQEKVVENPLTDLHTVVDADSSQIEAIEMAKRGRSFVLQGPPGTGKSQTITNIIAECLYDGKTVLFVSEKQAALNVVYDKLKKAGLNDFCLELHSHKANKKAVIDELNRTLELPRRGVSPSAEEEIRQKKNAQAKLDSYAEALHRVRKPINRSLYQLFEGYSRNRAYPELPVVIHGVQTKGQEYLQSASDLLEEYAECVPLIGTDYRKNAWYGFTAGNLDYERELQLKEDLGRLNGGFHSLKEEAGHLREAYGANADTYRETVRWQALLNYLAQSDVIMPPLLSRGNRERVQPYIQRIQELKGLLEQEKNELCAYCSLDILQAIDGAAAYRRLTEEFSSSFSRLFNREYKEIVSTVQTYASNRRKPDYQKLLDITRAIGRIQAIETELQGQMREISGYLGSCYRGADTEWGRVWEDLNRLKDYDNGEAQPFGDLPGLSMIGYPQTQAGFRDAAVRIGDLIRSVNEAKTRVSQLFRRGELDLEQGKYTDCLKKIAACYANFDKLPGWKNFLEVRGKLIQSDLIHIVDSSIDEGLAPEQLAGAFRRAFYKQWIGSVLNTESGLRSFSGVSQTQTAKLFAEKDRLQYKINKNRIHETLSGKRPDLDWSAQGGLVTKLRREGIKKRKQMPIRKLLAELGELAQTLKPCFLMSPLSVSTYLDPDTISFDTVIFDEASQIFPQDAIGSIYRGRQLIVVGDSKQMPPSNFFTATASGEEDPDEEETAANPGDYESILDLCEGVFSTKTLLWHYRSHYEQLIAFSNLHFYDNRLTTFPSVKKDREGIGVDFYPVEGGVFDRKSKTNRKEAEYVVNLIYRNMQDYPDRSLGVVAFSAAQQDLIDRLLYQRRAADPSNEEFFRGDKKEPFFIKNLETVQGDERDTIIFSVAYAKDSMGRFIQNFGPLNKQGGEKRLNVAVTRARDNVQLVSSIRCTDIDISRSKNSGPALLRAYLDYAERGEDALERTLTVAEEDRFDSPFEAEVCDFLRGEGYTADTQVGCSGYRIDIGLRRPGTSDYLMAIECDGASYHSSKNARDRDELRQSVLESMGWKFYRVWSTDWYKNREAEKARLIRAAEEAIRGADEKETRGERTENGEDDPEDHTEFFPDTVIKSPSLQTYRELDAAAILRKYNGRMTPTVLEILQTEAPLSEEYLVKRLLPALGKEKATKALVKSVHEKIFWYKSQGIQYRGGFLYLSGMSEYPFRVPGDKREIQYIALEELAQGMYMMITQNVAITRDDLYKSMTLKLGFNRTGNNIAERYDKALNLLIQSGMVTDQDGMLSAGRREP